jgi:CMP-N,N'-diacetyllegionaminic acid synthase
MYQDKHIVCIIPARGGSKRLPGKNIKLLNGKPLISYAIAAAKGSKYIDRVLVSTDDEAIAAVAKECGAEVPFMRPAELASDTATALQVMQHAVTVLEDAGQVVNATVLVQPTVPGVTTTDIDSAIEALYGKQAKSCITICEVIDPPAWMYRLQEDGHIVPFMEPSTARSQDLEKFYRVNGAAYVTPRSVLMEGNVITDNSDCVSVVMPRARSTDIDTAFDFYMAEQAMLFETKK